jgi:hypothetical protein
MKGGKFERVIVWMVGDGRGDWEQEKDEKKGGNYGKKREELLEWV